MVGARNVDNSSFAYSLLRTNMIRFGSLEAPSTSRPARQAGIGPARRRQGTAASLSSVWRYEDILAWGVDTKARVCA